MLSKIDDGGAPMMLGKDKIIAPDFDCYGGCSAYRYSVYIDSKVKGGPILFRLKKQVRHGINERNYRHYMKCAELADKPCALAITELFTDYDDPSTWSGCLLLQSLTKLGTPEYSIPGTEPEAKAYWQRKRFRPVGAFGLMSLNEIARGAVVPNLKAHFDEVFDNREQGNLF